MKTALAALALPLIASSPAGSAVLFEDEFEDGDASGWEEIDGTFTVTGGEYHVTSSGFCVDARAAAGDMWENYILEADFDSVDGQAAVLFRVETIASGCDAGRYYQFAVHAGGGASFCRMNFSGGNCEILASAPYALSPGERHHLRLDVVDASATASIDDVEVLSVTGLTHYPAGRIGLKRINGGTTSYDNVRVTGNEAGCEASASGLVSWWPADGTANDAVGEQDGSLAGDAAFAAGHVDQSFSFDGNGRIAVTDSSAWAFGGSDFTIGAWVYFDSIPGRAPFVGYNDGSGEQNKWIFWYDTTGHDTPPGPALRFHINSPSIGPRDPVYATWSPATDRWYHVLVARAGQTYTLYLDGIAVQTMQNGFAVPDASGPLTIGESEGYHFDGRIDDVMVFHRALSAAEVAAMVAAGPDACAAACNDGLDNEGDGGVDLGDRGCADSSDIDERDPAHACDDGVDNDGDGRVDFSINAPTRDIGCFYDGSSRENPECQDGIDNDAQAGIDFDGGGSLDLDQDGYVDAIFNPTTPLVGPPDPQCAGNPTRQAERSGCGLGAELLFATGLIWSERRRLRRR